mgnify:CR=1 FL=1
MRTMIELKSTEDVQEFVNAASKCPFEIDLQAMDVNRRLQILIEGDNNEIDAFHQTIQKFAIA